MPATSLRAAADGMIWLSRLTEHSTFAGGMLGPELLLGAGLGPLFVLIFLVGLTKVGSGAAWLGVPQLDGHPFQRPSRATVAGTSSARTRKASMRMPIAMDARMPVNTPPPGCLPTARAKTPKVPARTSPAELTVGPVCSSARVTACRSGIRLASARSGPSSSWAACQQAGTRRGLVRGQFPFRVARIPTARRSRRLLGINPANRRGVSRPMRILLS